MVQPCLPNTQIMTNIQINMLQLAAKI
uniref:Uncharacterized protein n=1 Tax=Arundo donax TaxID=35708 RepID=A0A0A9HB26_ARUDO